MHSPYTSIRILSFLPGLVIVAFIVFIGTVIPIYYIPMITESTSFWGLLGSIFHFIFFLWCYIGCIWGFVKTIITHPGPITATMIKDYEERYGIEDRVCSECHIKKIPRIHHCSICKMCSFNMDHHCPWVCNCVGYLNKKFFILFLFYAWIGCFDISLSYFFYSYQARLITEGRIVFSMVMVLALTLFITLTFFGGFHLWMVFNDYTTIEMTDYCSSCFRGSLDMAETENYYENWCNVMDQEPYLWFLPIHDKEFTYSWSFLDNENRNNLENESQSLLERTVENDILRIKAHMSSMPSIPDV